MSENSDDKPPIGEDIVWGAKGIAKETKGSESQARYWVRTGKVRVGRLPNGREYFTTKQELRRTFTLKP
jgi:hypothetical protein